MFLHDSVMLTSTLIIIIIIMTINNNNTSETDESISFGQFHSRCICMWLHDCGANSDYVSAPDPYLLTYLFVYSACTSYKRDLAYSRHRGEADNAHSSTTNSFVGRLQLQHLVSFGKTLSHVLLQFVHFCSNTVSPQWYHISSGNYFAKPLIKNNRSIGLMGLGDVSSLYPSI